MSAEDSSNLNTAFYTSDTGGRLKYMKTYPSVAVSAIGGQIDINALYFEADKRYAEHCLLVNTGSEQVYIAFDTDAALIDIADNDTYNVLLDENNSGITDRIILDGVVFKLAYKCATGKTSTLRILIW